MTIFEINDYLLERGFTLVDELCKYTLKDSRLFFKYYEAEFCILANGIFKPYIIKPATGYNSNYYTSFYTIPRYDNDNSRIRIKYEDITVAILEEFCDDFIKSYKDILEYNKKQKELMKLDKINEDF